MSLLRNGASVVVGGPQIGSRNGSLGLDEKGNARMRVALSATQYLVFAAAGLPVAPGPMKREIRADAISAAL